MRVIGGKAKGLRLQPVPGEGVRPIMDRVKESLFNVLGPDVQGASFLDLFGGTGSVGIEALSRGAAFVRVVDVNPLAIRTIWANLRATRLEREHVEVIKGDALTLLKGKADRKFDYVYIAPPQYQALWLDALRVVDSQPEWLSEDAWVIAQIHPLEYQPVQLDNLSEFDRRRYGSTMLVFFEREYES